MGDWSNDRSGGATTQFTIFGTEETPRPADRRRVEARPDGSQRVKAAKGAPRCEDCANLVRKTWSRTYTKCRLTDSGGPATDISGRDAACRMFEARELRS